MVPAGATVIDASNEYLIPGIIDCHSHIAVGRHINEGSVSVSSMVNIKDIINPEDIAIYRALAGGVTTANILHGSANAIGGRPCRSRCAGARDAEELIFAGRDAGHQVRAGRESQARRQSAGGRGAAANHVNGALSRDPHGRGRHDPRGIQ